MSDYVTGKQDWLAAGLPVEGTLAGLPRAGDVARKDVPTCRIDERLGDVKARVKGLGWNLCVVVNEASIVFGLFREKELEKADDLTVEQAMRPGPSTFRPNVPITEMAEYMTEHDLKSSPVTTSDGRLFGVLIREDAERVAREVLEAMHEAHLAHHEHG